MLLIAVVSQRPRRNWMLSSPRMSSKMFPSLSLETRLICRLLHRKKNLNLLLDWWTLTEKTQSLTKTRVSALLNCTCAPSSDGWDMRMGSSGCHSSSPKSTFLNLQWSGLLCVRLLVKGCHQEHENVSRRF